MLKRESVFDKTFEPMQLKKYESIHATIDGIMHKGIFCRCIKNIGNKTVDCIYFGFFMA